MNKTFIISFVLAFACSMTVGAQNIRGTKQQKNEKFYNKILYVIESSDGKEYLASNYKASTYEVEFLHFGKVGEQYKKKGIESLRYIKLVIPSTKLIRMKDFLKQQGVTVTKQDTIYISDDIVASTLYDPLFSRDYVVGVKRIGHGIHFVVNENVQSDRRKQLQSASWKQKGKKEWQERSQAWYQKKKNSVHSK